MAFHNWHTIYMSLTAYKEQMKDKRAIELDKGEYVVHLDRLIDELQRAIDGAWAEITVGEDDGLY